MRLQATPIHCCRRPDCITPTLLPCLFIPSVVSERTRMKFFTIVSPNSTIVYIDGDDAFAQLLREHADALGLGSVSSCRIVHIGLVPYSLLTARYGPSIVVVQEARINVDAATMLFSPLISAMVSKWTAPPLLLATLYCGFLAPTLHHSHHSLH